MTMAASKKHASSQCPICDQQVARLSSHLRHNPVCRQQLLSKNITNSFDINIPSEIGADEEIDIVAEQSDGISRRVSGRIRKATPTYSDNNCRKKKRVDDSNAEVAFPTPDLTLDDYVSTYVENSVCQPAQSTSVPSISTANPIGTGIQDADETANDVWEALFTDTMSEAATAPRPDERNPLPESDGSIPLRFGEIFTLPFSLQQARIVTTKWDKSMASLYRICDDARAPRYLCDKLMSQLRHEMLEHSFDPLHPGITTRNSFMHRVQKATGTSPPEQIMITLESGSRVTVYRFPFMETYQNYLLSEPFSIMDNLDVDPNDPFGDPDLNRNRLTEMHDGRWFRETYKQFLSSVEDPKQYLFTDLAIYADKTGTDRIEKNSLEPVVAFCPLLKKKVRENTNSHFILGFIPNLTTSSSALRRGRSQRQGSKSMSARDYHRCLEVILAPLKELQRSQPVMFQRRGDKIIRAKIYCQIAGAVGDNKSNDMLTARICDYGPTSP